MKSSSTHAGRKRRSAAEDNAEVVIKPHLSGAIPRESDQWWGGAKMKNAITGRAIILILRHV